MAGDSFRERRGKIDNHRSLIHRRGLLRAGAIGLAGLGLPDLLRGEALAAKTADAKSNLPGFGRAR